jgi:hypothetical protein
LRPLNLVYKLCLHRKTLELLFELSYGFFAVLLYLKPYNLVGYLIMEK